MSVAIANKQQMQDCNLYILITPPQAPKRIYSLSLAFHKKLKALGVEVMNKGFLGEVELTLDCKGLPDREGHSTWKGNHEQRPAPSMSACSLPENTRYPGTVANEKIS